MQAYRAARESQKSSLSVTAIEDQSRGRVGTFDDVFASLACSDQHGDDMQPACICSSSISASARAGICRTRRVPCTSRRCARSSDPNNSACVTGCLEATRNETIVTLRIGSNSSRIPAGARYELPAAVGVSLSQVDHLPTVGALHCSLHRLIESALRLRPDRVELRGFTVHELF